MPFLSLKPLSRRLVAPLVPCVVVAALTSCGSEKVALYPVRGQILVDGEPAARAFVMFCPVAPSVAVEKLRPSAETADDGRFELKTYVRGDGAPAGDYRVAVTWHGLPIGANAEDLPEEEWTAGPNQLPESYGDPERTPLTASVESSDTELAPFELNRLKTASKSGGHR
jgi:hypothetical protein